MKKYEIFTSPWARSRYDEDFFMQTTELLEELIEKDMKLGKIMTILVLFSLPDEKLEYHERSDLKQMQSKFTVLMYNHLLEKSSSNMAAVERLSKLMQLISKLRTSGHILQNQSLQPLCIETVEDNVPIDSINLWPFSISSTL